MKQEVEVIRAIAGAGKTTALLERIERAKAEVGGDPSAFGFATYTRTGRREAVERASLAWDVDPDDLQKEGWFRTHTSAALRCLGDKWRKGITVYDGADQEHRNWIGEVFDLKPVATQAGRDPLVKDSIGEVLGVWSRARHSLTDFRVEIQKECRHGGLDIGWSHALEAVTRYEQAKRTDGIVDFTDVLAAFAGYAFSPTDGLHKTRPFGDVPDVVEYMFDEHQDCSPLTDAVSHRLASGPRCKRVVVCGDPQQSIMGFLGASPKCFETWDATTKTFLYHSHRVPEHVGRTAEESLTMQPGFGHCRDGITWRDSDSVDLDARFVYEITRRTLYGYLGTINWQKEREGTTLVLARTRRLAMTAQAAFRRRGIPAALIGQNFRTKWVRAHESWLRFERGEGVSWEAFRNMVATCRSQLVLDDGTRDIISFSNIDKVRRKRVVERDVVFLTDLPEYGFSELTMNLVKSGDHYLLLNTRYRDEFGNMTMLYPDQFERPRVQLGTIHSAKGMEADHVILLPEVGKRIQSRCASDPEFRAEECRLTYVAITRAKKTCTVPYRFARPRNLYGLNCLPLSFLKMPRW